ncbi:EamA family transporter [Actinomadura kijaniata]|uniref:EamA family transporter n=1 Tax=Actinomadura kijaniata TaxID=46161 RepID=UPI003F1C685F
MSNRSTAGGLALGVVSAICFGFSGPLARMLIDAGLSAVQMTWLRLGAGALALLAAGLVLRPRELVVPRGHRWFAVRYALVGFAAVQGLYYATVARLPVSLASLLEYTAPVMVVAWLWLARRVRVPASAAVGALCTLLGMALVTEVWTGLTMDPLGLALGLATGVTAAAYFLLTQSSGERLPPFTAVTWGLTGAALALTVPARPWEIPWGVLAGDVSAAGHRVPAPLVLGWLVLVTTLLAYFLNLAAIRRLSAAVGAPVAALEAVSSAVLAWVLLGQSLGPAQIAGGLVMLAGIVVAQRAVTRLTAQRAHAPAENRSSREKVAR